MSDAKKVFLSASRIDSFNECSQRYAARYLLKMPDVGNEGSSRGSTNHDTVELLAKPKHEHLFAAAVHHQTCREVPALWRFIKRKARSYKVGDEKNLDIIDSSMIVALMNEFRGPKGTIADEIEKEFSIEVDEDGKRYNVRGFIDRIFTVKDDLGLLLDIRDFKGSKSQFEGSKLETNIQSIIYRLVAKRLYPHISRRRFRFLFLRFPDNPWQEPPPLTDDELELWEYELTDLQTKMEQFTAADVPKNLAAHKGEIMIRSRCGKEGFKKDGSPFFICPAQLPRDYWVIVDAEGNPVRGGDTEADLTKDKPLEPGQRTEKRRYPGCCAFFKPDGTRLPFQPR